MIRSCCERNGLRILVWYKIIGKMMDKICNNCCLDSFSIACLSYLDLSIFSQYLILFVMIKWILINLSSHFQVKAWQWSSICAKSSRILTSRGHGHWLQKYSKTFTCCSLWGYKESVSLKTRGIDGSTTTITWTCYNAWGEEGSPCRSSS